MDDKPRLRVYFVVESGTDVRLVDGLSQFCDLTVLARRIAGGVEINRTPQRPVSMWIGDPALQRFARQAAARVRRDRAAIDFVLVQGYGPAAAAVNAALRLTGLPGAMLVCSPTEEYYRCRAINPTPGKPFRGWELAALHVLARLNARLGTGYIVLSHHLADTVRRHGARGTVEIVPVYGVDTARYAPPAASERAALRGTRQLPSRGEIIFFSSRIAPEKDSLTLLKAFARLVREGRDVYLLHRSGGYRELLALAQEHGVADRVIASDAVHPDELPVDYACSDLCVQASRAEGLGYSVLEALACGTPVVASATGGLVETVIPGETGWTCVPGDEGSLTLALREALDHPVEARRRAAAGRAMVQQRFERTVVFAQLEAVMRRRVHGVIGDAAVAAGGA